MRTTIFSTVAFLSSADHEHPTLEVHEKIPENHKGITITDYLDNPVIPEGFDEDGNPYFSEEFYQKLLEKSVEIITYDRERARNLFWFNVHIRTR